MLVQHVVDKAASFDKRCNSQGYIHVEVILINMQQSTVLESCLCFHNS